MIDPRFGSTFRVLREGAGVTLREFARRGDVDHSHWSKVERGQRSPPVGRTLAGLLNDIGLDLEAHGHVYDLAYIARGEIPADILQSKHCRDKLPEVFKRLRVEGEEQ